MAATRKIEVRIVADTRQLRRSLLKARMLLEPSPLRRTWLRFRLWRISQEEPVA